MVFIPNFRTPTSNINNWREDQFNENLIHGIIDWCVWSMLDLGAYRNVSITDISGIYGGTMSKLRPVQDPNYTDGQIWEAIRSDWVWEKNITYNGTLPAIASGVYINDVFYPTASTIGTYAHSINFPLGRIIFNSPISITLPVSADYCYREVSVVPSKEVWFTELLYNSLNMQSTDFLSPSGGIYSHLAQARRQMPAIGVELVTRRTPYPYEIGALTQLVNQDILFYVLAENETDRNQLADLLTSQSGKTILLTDRKLMKTDSRYPLSLDFNGSPLSSPMYYPDIINNFMYTSARIVNMTTQMMSTINSWLYRAVVRATFQAVI